MKHGIQGRPVGIGSEDKARYQAACIERYWKGKGYKNIFVDVIQDRFGNWRVSSNLDQILVKKSA
jgi:hypothetical protein